MTRAHREPIFAHFAKLDRSAAVRDSRNSCPSYYEAGFVEGTAAVWVGKGNGKGNGAQRGHYAVFRDQAN